MSTVVSKNYQIGADGTATNNFTIFQPATPDGTLRIGNGNTGITSSLLALTSAGNLGIGTSSPGYKLDVASGDASAGQAIRIRANASAAAGGLQFTDSGATTQYGWIKGKTTGLSFYGGNNSAGDLFLDTSGNLGLGVTPSAWNSTYNGFDIGGSSISGRTSTNNQLDLASNGFRNAAGNWVYKYTGGAVRLTVDGSGSGFQWYTAPSGTAGNAISFTQAMTLDASGNLGIGTTSPARRLSVLGGSGDNVPLRVTAGAGSIDCYIDFKDPTTTADYKVRVGSYGDNLVMYAGGSERARIDSSGNLLIGKTIAAASSGNGCWLSNNGMMSVVGSSSLGDTFNYYNSTAGAYRFYVNNAGTIFATSTTITSLSDVRHKENIRDLDDGLAAIMSLQPRKFDWKEGKGANIKNARGFIAQEFEQVFPDLIDEWKDPAPEGEEPYKSVRADLIPVLVKAIQELNAKLEAQAAEIAALKGQA